MDQLNVAAVQPDCVSAEILPVLGNRPLGVLSAILCFCIAWCLDITKIVFHWILCVIEDLNHEKQFFVPFANRCESFFLAMC